MFFTKEKEKKFVKWISWIEEKVDRKSLPNEYKDHIEKLETAIRSLTQRVKKLEAGNE